MRIVIIMTMLFGLALGGQTKEVPLGDKDFYPTPERPIGFRGDNNGYFPGAKIVTEFYEAPPVEDTMEIINGRGHKVASEFINLGKGPSKNIVWKVKLPSCGNTQPIVVGDKVFTLAEPDMMVCLSAKSGKILWVDSVNPWEIEAIERFGGDLSAEQKKAVHTARDLYEIWLALDAVIAFEYHFNTCGRYPTYEEFKEIFDTFAEKELPAVLKRLNELDTDGGYDEEAKKTVACVEFIADQKLYGDVINRHMFSIFRKIQEFPNDVLTNEAKTFPVFFGKVTELNTDRDKAIAAIKKALDVLKQNEAANAPLAVDNLFERFEKKEYHEIRKAIDSVPADTASEEVKAAKAALVHFSDVTSDGYIRTRLSAMFQGVLAEAAKFAEFSGKELPALYKRLNDLEKPVGKHDQDRITLIINLIKQNKFDPSRQGVNRGEVHSLANRIRSRIRTLTNTERDREVPLELPWRHMVGFNMSVPVSDGKYVYASFGQGMTVCWDLNGNRIWARFFYQGLDWGRYVHHILSPMLAKNIIVDMHGYGTMRGLDTATGKTVWEAPAKGANALDGGGYYCSGHKVMKLGDEYYLITALCNIIRMSDGKVVGEIPFKHKPAGGPYVTGSGDIVIKASNGDSHSAPITAFRLKVQPDGMVSAEQIWESENRGTDYQTHVHADNFLVTQNNKTNIMNASTGEVYVKDNRPNFGYMSKILAGDTLVWLVSRNNETFLDGNVWRAYGQDWNCRREDGKVTARFGTADLSNPKEPKMISVNNILGDINEPPVPYTEKWTPESFKNKNFWNASGGKPAHFAWSDTVLFPQGNRLFLRSVGYMYCIGDPSEKWHTPASAPAEARTAD